MSNNDEATIAVDASFHKGLIAFNGFQHPVFASTGVDAGAVEAHAGRAMAAHRHLSERFDHSAPFALLVLGPDDWAERSVHPAYGMPNYRDGNLIVAGTTNPFWEAFAVALADPNHPHAAAVSATYAVHDGRIDLAPFFDLLAVHELTHVFLVHRPVHLPRLWLHEFFCNLALHDYVASREPGLLATLETFPRAFAATDAAAFEHRSLAAFEAHYAFGMDPANYGWYQCRFHVAAARAHSAAGCDGLRRLWDAFAGDQDLPAIPSDTELADLLDQVVHHATGDVIRSW